jgi:hypothetical protein
MTRSAPELERLRGVPPGEPPPGAEVDVLVAQCGEAAELVLARVRELLVRVLDRPEPWPSIPEWKQILPAWFVESCVDDSELRSCVVDRWSLRAWLHWFRPGHRAWEWWDAAADGNRLTIRLVVRRRPYLRGALDWLLRAAGANSAEPAPSSG